MITLVAGLDIQILDIDGSTLRHLTLDPRVDYQRMPWGQSPGHQRVPARIR